MENNKINHRHAFLLTFFNQDEDHYEEKEVNGFWLVKQWNGATKNWIVAIFPKESFKKYNQNKLGFDELENLDNDFKRSLLD